MIASFPLLLTVPSQTPIHTVQELLDYAKANPEKFTYGSTGTGTSPHLAVEEFAQRAGIKLTHVPFKGNADNMQAVLGDPRYRPSPWLARRAQLGLSLTFDEAAA